MGLYLARPLGAQDRLASLSGTVTDPSGSVVPNVSVTASDGQSAMRAAETDAHGRYTIGSLAAGTYTLRAMAPGFSVWETPGYKVAAGAAQSMDIPLTLSAQAEQVTVAATDDTKIDTDPSNNVSALNLEKSDLDALPDDPDDLTADLQALAGPAAGPDGADFYIDGFTGGRLPPKDSIREIRLNQNPFAAQYEHAGHGRIEIFTKPGTDALHGYALFVFSDQALNSRNPFVAVKPPYQRRQWEGALSGSLGKKTSYSADFERRDISENAFVNALVLDPSFNIVPFTQGVVTPLTGLEVNVKVDRQLSTNHTLTARLSLARDTNDNQGVGGFTLAARGYNADSGYDSFQLVETGVLNLHTINETRFRFLRQNSDQSGGSTAQAVTVRDAFSTGGSPVGTSYDHEHRYELQNFTSHAVGVHSIRYGGVFRGVTLENQSEANYLGTFTFTSLASYQTTLLGIQNHLDPATIRAMGGGASQFSITTGNPLLDMNQFDWSVFAQDDWRVLPHLTLSGGLRYEGQTHVSTGVDMNPRAAFAWAIGSDKNGASKNVIRGGAGMFHTRLSEQYTLNALRQNGIRQQSFLILNPDFYPVAPLSQSLLATAQPQTIRETDAHWRTPAMIQTSIGYEGQLPKHVTLSSNYIHSIGYHQLRSRSINAPLVPGGPLPYGGINSIYLWETSGIYRQNQLITNVNVRLSSKSNLSAYYAFGKAMSNTDGSGTFPANQYDLTTEYGRAGFDVRHRVQINGSIAMRHGFRVSPFITIASGMPFNITSGQDVNGDGLYTDRPSFGTMAELANPLLYPGVRQTPYGILNPVPLPGETIIPRNLGNGPGLVAANLRLSKTFTLSERTGPQGESARELVFSVNARNILNHPNPGAPDGNLSSPLFLQSTTLVSGAGASANRRLDLQVRFNF